MTATSIRALDAGLQKLDDTVSQQIEAINESLRGLVTIRIETAWTEDRSVAYGRLDGKWQLIMINERGNEFSALSASRNARAELLSSGVLDRLLDGAEEQLRLLIDQRNKALADAGPILERIAKLQEAAQ